MRCLIGLVSILALGAIGCSEESGTGDSGGTAGDGGGYICAPAIGEPGAGGGGYYPPKLPGVYSAEPVVGPGGQSVAVRFETSSDCTSLVPSTECALDSDNTEPAFFEIEFVGLDEQGGACSAGIAVTPEMVAEVPIQDAGSSSARFTIDVTDDNGAEWLIVGDFLGIYVEGSARRTDGDTYCETNWGVDEGCVL
jgi:hypothetical protein